jgi:hypothetical protein
MGDAQMTRRLIRGVSSTKWPKVEDNMIDRKKMLARYRMRTIAILSAAVLAIR